MPPASQNTTTHKECPPWAHSNSNGTACLCSIPESKTSVAKCSDTTLQLTACYCLSYYKDLNQTVYGDCLYSCLITHNSNKYTTSNLEKACDRYNRTAEMCGKCREGTGHPLYSYSLKCIACSNSTGTIFRYMAAALLPLTVFYVVVAAFRVSATAERLSGYILMSQIITTPAQLRYITSLTTNRPSAVAIKLSLAVHAIWNLDFFRGMYTLFCYSDSTSTMMITSLEYLIALYPLGLILLTYFLVNVHDRFYLVSQIWRPVHNVFNRIRHRWSVKRCLHHFPPALLYQDLKRFF